RIGAGEPGWLLTFPPRVQYTEEALDGFSAVHLMHHLQSAVVLALALGLALPAVATVSPSHAGKAHGKQAHSARVKAHPVAHPSHSSKTSSAHSPWVAVHDAPVSSSGQRHASSAR